MSSENLNLDLVRKSVIRTPLVKQKKSKEQKSIYSHDGKLKNFEQIDVSTKTIIGMTNLRIDLDKFFEYMPITDYKPKERKRGRKRKIDIQQINHTTVPYGSIITLEKSNLRRGIKLKKSKNKKTFLHTVSVSMFLENEKDINIKVYSNGKFHITGCKTDDHFIRAIIQIYNTMKLTQEWTGEKIFYLEKDKFIDNDEQLCCLFYVAMKNMDFYIGFEIDREKLDKFINNNTDYNYIFIDGDLSTSVNVKVKYDLNVYPDLVKFTYISGDPNPDNDNSEQELVCSTTLLEHLHFYDILETKEKKKVLKKDKCHTFLIFSSGSIIMSSGAHDSVIKQVFNDFISLLLNNKQYVQEHSVKKHLKGTQHTKSRNNIKTVSENNSSTQIVWHSDEE